VISLSSVTVSPAVVAAAVAGAFALAALVVWAGARLLRGALLPVDIISAEDRAAVQARARQLLRAVTFIAFGLAGLASLALAVSLVGAEIPDWTPRAILAWVMSHGVHTAIILAVAYLTIHVAHLGIEYFHLRATGGPTASADGERRRRAATLSAILTRLTTVIVVFGAGLMVLHELAINVLPILTGAGIAGLAVGFGAQYLVRDVIAGFFLILEDQVRVGDLARIQGVTGLVEQINLRTIVLRDGDGAAQVFPNGTITTLANLSKEYSYAVVDVVVPLREDLDRVMATLEEIGAGMRSDLHFGPMLLAPFESPGIDSLDDRHATIRVRFRTPPLMQGQVGRELRRRIASEFTARGIRPFGRKAEGDSGATAPMRV
jgi:small-conductance mechanosensitive channel